MHVNFCFRVCALEMVDRLIVYFVNPLTAYLDRPKCIEQSGEDAERFGRDARVTFA